MPNAGIDRCFRIPDFWARLVKMGRVSIGHTIELHGWYKEMEARSGALPEGDNDQLTHTSHATRTEAHARKPADQRRQASPCRSLAGI